MEALVERIRRRLLPALHGSEELQELRWIAVRRRVQDAGQVEDRPERRVDDALEGQRVEDRRAVARPAYRDSEVRHARVGATDVAEDTPRAAELVQAEVGLPHLRYHGIEHQLRHAPWMRQGVALPDVGAVRDAVDDPAPDAERLPQRLQVRDHVVGAEELTAVAELRRAGANRGGRWRCEVGAPHRGLQRRAVERARTGASLVEHDDSVGVLLGAENLRHPRQRRHARLARAAGQ